MKTYKTYLIIQANIYLNLNASLCESYRYMDFIQFLGKFIPDLQVILTEQIKLKVSKLS